MRARLVLLGIAACALALAAAADPTLSPAELWRQRIAEAREWKLWIATAATALVALGWALQLVGRERALRRLRDALLVALALCTLFAWWHPYRGSLRAWLHVGDSYHYYMGAKYFPELGYTRLYECTVVADAEAGLTAALARSQIRNLATNRLESAELSLRNPGRCKRHFSPERWQAFERDLRFFRSKLTIPLWFKLRVDHGYNPPPTWTVLGSLLARTAPTPDRAQFLWLTALDPLLIAAMFATLAWGFGWRTMCVALIYWGANQPANWEWVGGSIVRFDWLAASAAAICCLRRGRPVAAGLLVAWAAGIRIFPVAIAGGVGLAALLRMLRERSRRPSPDALRFGTAFAAGLALLVGLSSLVVGPRSWWDFVANSRLHVATDSVNRSGLRPLLAYRYEHRLAATLEPEAKDPYARWRELRARDGEARRPLFFAIALLHLALLVLALRHQPYWVAGVLGIGAVPVLLELGSYYFGFLLLFACLGSRWKEIDVALLALAAFSWWVGTWGGPDRDVVVARTSLAIVTFVMGVTARVALARGEPERGAGAA
jgi:hypothetical protein